MGTEREKTFIYNEDSRPDYGLWYYLVPVFIFLSIHFLLCLYSVKNDFLYDGNWLRSLGRTVFDIDGFALATIGTVLDTFFINAYYFIVRLVKNRMYKKDPLRKIIRGMTIFNIFVLPVFFMAGTDGIYIGDATELFVEIVIYLICLAGTGYAGAYILLLTSRPSTEEELKEYLRNHPYQPASSSKPSPATQKSTGSWFKTRNYFGSHGEFDRNDRERAYNEDILSERLSNRNFDAKEHYGWEHELNYDSDGYRDEER